MVKLERIVYTAFPKTPGTDPGTEVYPRETRKRHTQKETAPYHPACSRAMIWGSSTSFVCGGGGWGWWGWWVW